MTDLASILTEELQTHGSLFLSSSPPQQQQQPETLPLPLTIFLWNQQLETSSGGEVDVSCSSLPGSIIPSTKSSPVKFPLSQHEKERQFASNVIEHLNRVLERQEGGGSVSKKVKLEEDQEGAPAIEEQGPAIEEQDPSIVIRPGTPYFSSNDNSHLRIPSSVQSNYSLSSDRIIVPNSRLIARRLLFPEGEGINNLLLAASEDKNDDENEQQEEPKQQRRSGRKEGETRGRKAGVRKFVPLESEEKRKEVRTLLLNQATEVMFDVYNELFASNDKEEWDDSFFDYLMFSIDKNTKFRRQDKRHIHLLQIIMRKCADCRAVLGILDDPERLRVEAFKFCSVQPTFLAPTNPGGLPPKSSSFRHNLQTGGIGPKSPWPNADNPILPIALFRGENLCKESGHCEWFVPSRDVKKKYHLSKLRHQCFEFDEEFKRAFLQWFTDDILLNIARKFKWNRTRALGNFAMSKENQRTKMGLYEPKTSDFKHQDA